MKFINKLDQVLEEIRSRWSIPGLGVGIVEAGRVIHTRCLGVQSLDTGAPVTEKSMFCLASVGKCFVASAVMQLVERGNIHLDAPIVRYLPYFKLEDERFQLITIRQVLSHTSGIPDMDEFEYNDLVAHPEMDEGAAERYVRTMGRLKLIHAPGEKFLYSNIAYNILGALVARVSGQTFEETMRANILLPSGMHDSTFLPSEMDPQRLVSPHLRLPAMTVNPVTAYHRADAPASFLHASVEDMCAWAMTLLNGGVHQGRQLLSPASLNLMWTAAAQRGSPPLRENMGLGWNLGHFEGVRTVSHGGGGFGWTCLFILLPDMSSGAIILSNDDSSSIWRLNYAVIRTMLDLEPQAGSISWMIPITQALQAGGMQAALACYENLKERVAQDYIFNDYELLNLVYGLEGAGKLNLAMEVLTLNLRAFPESVDTCLSLARLHLHMKQPSHAKAFLQKALLLDPDNSEARQLMQNTRQEE
jgi:CubicO group peptidase (beta-lactamase class C family)